MKKIRNKKEKNPRKISISILALYSRHFSCKLIDQLFHFLHWLVLSPQENVPEQDAGPRWLCIQPNPSVDPRHQLVLCLLRQQVQQATLFAEQLTYEIYAAGKHQAILELAEITPLSCRIDADELWLEIGVCEYDFAADKIANVEFRAIFLRCALEGHVGEDCKL